MNLNCEQDKYLSRGTERFYLLQYLPFALAPLRLTKLLTALGMGSSHKKKSSNKLLLVTTNIVLCF